MDSSIPLTTESSTGNSGDIIQEVAGSPKGEPVTQSTSMQVETESPGDAENQAPSTKDVESMGDLGSPAKEVSSLKLKRRNRSGAEKKRRRKARNRAQGGGQGSGSLAKGDPSEAPPGAKSGPSDTSKRTRPVDSPYEDKMDAKKARPTWPLSYAGQSGIKVAIVDEGFPQVVLTQEKGNLIQVAVCELMDSLPEGGDILRFNDCYLSKGALIVICHDEPSWTWLKTAIPTIKAWEGSRLKIIELDVPLAYKRFRAWFPGLEVENEVILQRLKRQNPGISIKKWKFYDRKVEPRGVRIVVDVDSDSADFILRKTSKLYCGLTQAVFTLVGAISKKEEAEIQHNLD